MALQSMGATVIMSILVVWVVVAAGEPSAVDVGPALKYWEKMLPGVAVPASLREAVSPVEGSALASMFAMHIQHGTYYPSTSASFCKNAGLVCEDEDVHSGDEGAYKGDEAEKKDPNPLFTWKGKKGEKKDPNPLFTWKGEKGENKHPNPLFTWKGEKGENKHPNPLFTWKGGNGEKDPNPLFTWKGEKGENKDPNPLFTWKGGNGEKDPNPLFTWKGGNGEKEDPNPLFTWKGGNGEKDPNPLFTWKGEKGENKDPNPLFTWKGGNGEKDPNPLFTWKGGNGEKEDPNPLFTWKGENGEKKDPNPLFTWKGEKKDPNPLFTWKGEKGDKGDEAVKSEADKEAYRYKFDKAGKEQDAPSKGYFFYTDLVEGATLRLKEQPAIQPRSFLPRVVGDALPSLTPENLLKLRRIFNIQEGTHMYDALAFATRVCESDFRLEGEERICPASLESLVDFLSAHVGPDVKVLTSSPRPRIVMGPVKVANFTVHHSVDGTPDAVLCHIFNFPWQMYMCHTVPDTEVVEASLTDAEGMVIQAVGVCHLDTKMWSPGHEAFRILGTQPGTPVCHWSAQESLVWVSTKSEVSAAIQEAVAAGRYMAMDLAQGHEMAM